MVEKHVFNLIDKYKWTAEESDTEACVIARRRAEFLGWKKILGVYLLDHKYTIEGQQTRYEMWGEL